MPRLTRQSFGETIRKQTYLGLFVIFCTLAFSGCATPGSNHVYATTQTSKAIYDVTTPDATLTHAVQAWERVLGLAYDYNTDHLFVRLWPQQIIRVIERPSGKILRQMRLPAPLHTVVPADLAVRSSDRHLFAIHPDGHSVVELTLFGGWVRQITFPAQTTTFTGLAYDQRGDHLLLLAGQTVLTGTLDGQIMQSTALSEPVRSVTLAYDSDAKHFYAPLADGVTLGEFDADGHLLSRQPVAAPAEITGLDAGPRSLVRVF